MKLIAQYIAQQLDKPEVKAAVTASPEPFRALIWESEVFSKEFLENVLDPIGSRTPEMSEIWITLNDELETLL